MGENGIIISLPLPWWAYCNVFATNAWHLRHRFLLLHCAMWVLNRLQFSTCMYLTILQQNNSVCCTPVLVSWKETIKTVKYVKMSPQETLCFHLDEDAFQNSSGSGATLWLFIFVPFFFSSSPRPVIMALSVLAGKHFSCVEGCLGL